MPAFDAVVVGSGATGGWVAKKLAEAGLSVVLVEAGQSVSRDDIARTQPTYPFQRRAFPPKVWHTIPIQRLCYACNVSNYKWFVNDLEDPYSVADGTPFVWHRLRVLGGRTMVWAGQSYRLGEQDFKAASRDGYGQDWPFSYSDLAPYYDEVERYVGISGQSERNACLPDGSFLPPMDMTSGELLLRDRAKARFNYTVTIGRTAVLTQRHNDRSACRHCGPCWNGCATFSYFSSPFTTVADALASGHCTLVTNALVVSADVDPTTNRARGVTFIDRSTHAVRDIRARVVILCAQALESTRILLNSKTREHPCGLGNSSGVLGHYLMDHVSGSGATGFLSLPSQKLASDPLRPVGIYVVRFRNIPGSSCQSRFIRGYGFQGASGPRFNFDAPGFGIEYKDAVKQGTYPISLMAFGESLARVDNYCEIDPDLKDAWGIPALRVRMTHGANERAMMDDAAVSAAELLEACEATGITLNSDFRLPGTAIHEVGTARMGLDPQTSVLDSFNEVHDVKNLFVMDGSCFPSSACQHPTLTMMAVAVRACDRLIERFRCNEL